MLSIVIPAYNEAIRLGPTLARIQAWRATLAYSSSLLVVDDGSQDATAAVAQASGAELWRLPQNYGKGRAVREGLLRVKGDFCLITDADLSTPIEECTRLWAALAGGAALAIGSRSLPGSKVERHQPWYRESMGRHFNRIVQGGILPGYIDTQCGFKLFKAAAISEIIPRLSIDGFAFDVEMLLIARRRQLPVVQVPVRWRDDPDSRVGIVRDSTQMLWELARIAWQDQCGAYR